ncbi:MAG: helix-turn-helix transcriptional regulator [Acidiferrobacterales bacterium]
MPTESLPYGKVKNPAHLGQIVRAKRKQDQLTQADVVALCGIGTRFLSELENGKPTLELGKVLQLVACLGLEVTVGPRSWPA